jgi:hypothetical protein
MHEPIFFYLLRPNDVFIATSRSASQVPHDLAWTECDRPQKVRRCRQSEPTPAKGPLSARCAPEKYSVSSPARMMCCFMKMPDAIVLAERSHFQLQRVLLIDVARRLGLRKLCLALKGRVFHNDRAGAGPRQFLRPPGSLLVLTQELQFG